MEFFELLLSQRTFPFSRHKIYFWLSGIVYLKVKLLLNYISMWAKFYFTVYDLLEKTQNQAGHRKLIFKVSKI